MSIVRVLFSRITRCAAPYVSGFLHFLARAWPGAAIGLAIAAVLIPAYAGLCMGTGLGTIVDVGGALLVGTVVLALSVLLLMLALVIVRRIPLRFTAVLVVALGGLIATGMGFGFSPDFAVRLGGPPMLLFALGGAGLSILLRRGAGRAGAIYGLIGSLTLLVAILGAGVLVAWLIAPGQDPFLEDIGPVAAERVVPLDAPNPSQPGPYEVATVFYGSGRDQHRPEYGDKVDIQTESVDATPFVANPGGFKAWARRKYWGFEPNSLPLNARVWYPLGDGPFPLVLIVHGNHKMEEFSDPGYAYLGELLASRGFITASIDENFLNSNWSGDLGDENDARGWLLLKHLELWRDWNYRQDHPFHHAVDLDNIALIGHSRGGEAIMHAAAFNTLAHYPDDANILFDFGFSIRTLIAIAPIDGQYEPLGLPVPVENVNYLVLQGSHDSDLQFFAGARCYRRVALTDGNYWMKAALYIHRANHGQFNTVWGRYDVGPPLRHMLNRTPLLDAEDQRDIAKTYISGFLEATLRGRSEYLPMFRNHRCISHWLPATVYFSRFEDSDFRAVADFDESIDVTKTSLPGGAQDGSRLEVWRHQEMKGRGGWPFHDRAAVIGWNPANDAPDYTITLPDSLAADWRLDGRTILSFCLADTDERCEGATDEVPTLPDEPCVGAANGDTIAPDASEAVLGIDMTLALITSDGAAAELPLRHVFPLQPALKVTFTKWEYWERVRYQPAVEPVLQTFEIPLADFVQSNPEFNPARLSQIRWRFDRTRSRVILLDHVGFVLQPREAPVNTPQQDGAR